MKAKRSLFQKPLKGIHNLSIDPRQVNANELQRIGAFGQGNPLTDVKVLLGHGHLIAPL